MMYGIPPFYSTNHNLMYESIQKNEVHFPEQVSTSKEGKDFIRKVFFIKMKFSYFPSVY